MSVEHFDVLIVGAGISGIGAGYYLKNRCPARRYVILEGRSDLGGTWDLFRYPGVRSDSDMFTLGYSFRPWREPMRIAGGPAILNYVRETAHEFGIDEHIRFGQRVRSASWSSEQSRWTVEVDAGDPHTLNRYTCNFLFLCSGYYDHDEGYLPAFAGSEEFQGTIIHPQHWPAGLEYHGRQVVVIGSGATAVTLVPALAEAAAHVTMLQRSPSYILSVPARDRLARFVRRLMPPRAAYPLIRWKNLLLSLYVYQFCRGKPERAKRLLRRGVLKELPADIDVDVHFKPRYDPWDQRLCVAPDGDLFRALRAGRASVVTDQIVKFTHKGVLLESGRELPADIIVTATGLKLLAWGGIRLEVDGTVLEPGQCLTYKGLMLGNVPNLAICAGYANASWTLRAELSAKYVCRLLRHMERHGYVQCVPRCAPGMIGSRSPVPLTSGYIQRGSDRVPKQGSKAPWVVHHNYLLDLRSVGLAKLEDGVMEFSRASTSAHPPTATQPAR
jgi:cation diffusion facilitator CzcD-associated flavoprotein CzcO